MTVAIVCTGCEGSGASASPRRVVPLSSRPEQDITFFVAADTHYGAKLREGLPSIETLNRMQLAAMTALPGTPWPVRGGDVVAAPQAVLILGDLTDSGRIGPWQAFAADYGLADGPGRLGCPVFLCTGNHDRHSVWLRPVLNAVRRRHGALTYAWDFEHVRMICLDLYPDRNACRFLARELAATGRDRPVVIYFHYPLAGPYSGTEWWTPSEKNRFAETIKGYNIIGMFHGHYHGTLHYTWCGLDVYNVGSPRHASWSFVAVRITDTTMTVAAWDWRNGRWAWVHRKSFTVATAAPGRTPRAKK